MKARILVVDDEKDMTKLLQRSLESEIDCSVVMAFSGKMALSILDEEKFDLAICDIRMPGMDGFELLDFIQDRHPYLTVVMLTAFGNIESAVKAIKKGAYDSIPKPFEQGEIIFKIEKALERSLLLKENIALKEKKISSTKLIGDSEAMQKVFELITIAASNDVTVLVTGESGTGKDLTAQSIHALSSRKSKAFIPVNCPTIPEQLLESELFGYKKGAFTNAVLDRRGLFQEADQGTIFLDEIGDIGAAIQTKLLRVLQEKEIKPLGDTKVSKVDVRIIASTNRNLAEKILANEFREDFFYRLNVIAIELPPLRERITDIPVLSGHLVAKHCEKLNKTPKAIPENVMDLLMKQAWPGNIRELENVLIQGILYSKGEMITLDDIPIKTEIQKKSSVSELEKDEIAQLSYKEAKEKMLLEFTNDYVGAKLSMTKGNVTQAAKRCNMDRQALQQIMKRFSIDPKLFR